MNLTCESGRDGGTYAKVPASFILDRNLNAGAKRLWVLLDSMAGPHGTIQVRYASVAELLGRSERTIQRRITDLVEAGWLTIELQGNLSYGVYTVINPARDQPAALDRFETQVDPDGKLDPADRARRAEHARKAYFAGLALRSAQARRRTESQRA